MLESHVVSEILTDNGRKSRIHISLVNLFTYLSYFTHAP